MQPTGRRGHYDPTQPRAAAGNSNGGQWVDTDGADTASDRGNREQPQLAQFSPNRPPIRTGHPLIALLSLFAALSARNTPEQRAIFEFNAKAFLRDPQGELDRANVEVLNRRQVNNECRKLEDVQRRTDKAVMEVMRDGGQSMSRQQFGTAVHTNVKNQIVGRNHPNYRAEVSYWKMKEDEVYGRKDSIRIDVLENAGRGLVCVYDIKTGQSRRSGLDLDRMLEIAKNVLGAYPDAQRVIITEVRPRR
jgi:hypothetical protein